MVILNTDFQACRLYSLFVLYIVLTCICAKLTKMLHLFTIFLTNYEEMMGDSIIFKSSLSVTFEKGMVLRFLFWP